MFEKADIKNTKTILEPSDKQNVPAVINLYEALKEAVKFCETNTDRVLKEVEQLSMKILLHIFDSIFAIFTDPKIDLSKQLIRLSSQVIFCFISTEHLVQLSFLVNFIMACNE